VRDAALSRCWLGNALYGRSWHVGSPDSTWTAVSVALAVPMFDRL